MKRPVIALLFCFALICANAQAQQSETKMRIYSLHFVTVSDTHPTQTLWLVDGGDPNVAYKSLAAPILLQWVSRLPKGTEIDYASHWGTFPRLKNNHFPDDGMDKQLNPFADFCHSKGILFRDNMMVF